MKKLETLIQAVSTYSDDTAMDFGIEKSAMLIMKKMTEGMKLSNQEKSER